MKIRYTGQTHDADSSRKLLNGSIYPVLAFMIDLNSRVSTAIVLNDDRLSPVEITADIFEVVDQSLPALWHMEVELDLIVMAPVEWQSKDFWRGVFSGAADQVGEFNRILPRLYQQVMNQPLESPNIN